jgi:quinol monooxygenase YgiN
MDVQGGELKPVINVVATVELKEGKLQEYLDIFKKYVPKIRAEKGCIEYGATVDIQTIISI